MEEIDLKELIAMFLEKKLLICLIVLIFALCGAIYTLKFITPLYESKTSLILVQTSNQSNGSDSITSSDLSLNSQLVANYREVVKSKTVVSKVIDNLGLDYSIEQIQSATSVSTVSDTEIIQILVTNSDPETAAVIANELANVFVEKINEVYKVDNVHVLDKAEVAEEPSNINIAKNIVIFAFVGLIVVSGYILLINMLDTTVKTDSDIERNLGVPVLASIIFSGDNNTSKKKKSKSRSSSRSTSAKIENDIKSKNTSRKVNVESTHELDEDEELEQMLSAQQIRPTTEESVSLFSYVKNDGDEDMPRSRTRTTRSSIPSAIPSSSSVNRDISSTQIPTRRRKGGR